MPAVLEPVAQMLLDPTHGKYKVDLEDYLSKLTSENQARTLK
jgi:hypothetical protein